MKLLALKTHLKLNPIKKRLQQIIKIRYNKIQYNDSIK